MDITSHAVACDANFQRCRNTESWASSSAGFKRIKNTILLARTKEGKGRCRLTKEMRTCFFIQCGTQYLWRAPVLCYLHTAPLQESKPASQARGPAAGRWSSRSLLLLRACVTSSSLLLRVFCSFKLGGECVSGGVNRDATKL